MRLADKLITERKKSGLSQEQLADKLGVTRQSVSKWEYGSSLPELNKLVQLSEIFGVSVDYLVKDQLTEDPVRQSLATEQEAGTAGYGGQAAAHSRLEEKVDDLASYFKGYSYTSKIKIAGIPLVSIRFTRGRCRNGVAKGIIAIGNVAIGIISIGGCSFGVLSLGAVSAGLLSVGAVAFGGIALGIVAMGALALGVTALGLYAGGVVATGMELAAGVVATGKTAIGKVINGENLLYYKEGLSYETIRSFIVQNSPNIWKPVADLFAWFGSSIN